MFERIIKFRPAYDKTNVDPKKNYGIHGVDLLFVLKGEKGAVQFLLFTNWHLTHIRKKHEYDSWNKWFPMPADLGYHSYKPMYEDHNPIEKSCEWLDDKPCYYDGSTLNAERIYNILVEKGSDEVWKELEKYYKEVFEDA